MITVRQLRLLSEAVSEAESWRGSLVGAAPQEYLDEFDERIRMMRAAVRAAHDDRISILKISKLVGK